MRTVTLSEMRDTVRERANNQRATDAVIDESLNQYIAELYDLLVQVKGVQYFKATDPITITTVAGQAQYDLDDEVYKAVGVWWQVGTNDHHELLPYDQSKARGPVRTYGWNQYASHIYYQIEGTVLRLQPTPQAVHTVLIDYIPPSVRLVNDDDPFDGYNGWELYPIYRAAADVARDEEAFEQADRLEAKAEAMKARIEKMADRDHANAPTIQLRRGRDWNMGGSTTWDDEDSLR